MRLHFSAIVIACCYLGPARAAATPPRPDMAGPRHPGTHAPLSAPRPPKPIPDAEPGVTQWLRTALLSYADGSVAIDGYTEKARALHTPERVQSGAAELRAYGLLGELQLLERSVDGENRQYRYRARYRKQCVLVDIIFNKADKIDYLRWTPE
ncbi:MAG: hypothetical protein HYZ65_04575 [Burkholderiales bacterium]|nr:hypothetical protein [Burkholderiales bacterium]